MNKLCDVAYPVGNNCAKGWKYKDGESWIDDPTITLTCKKVSKNAAPFDSKIAQTKDIDTDADAALNELSSMANNDQMQLNSLFQDKPCKKFILKSDGGAFIYQQSRLGTYQLQKDVVNGRIVYFNEEKSQYLSWIDEYDKYWMVIQIMLNKKLINFHVVTAFVVFVGIHICIFQLSLDQIKGQILVEF